MKRFILAALLSTVACAAYAATATLSIIINSPSSTAVSCPIPTLTAPVASGATICTVSITPAGWSGVLSLSGPNASAFQLKGSDVVVGSTPLAAGSYSVTVTAAP